METLKEAFENKKKLNVELRLPIRFIADYRKDLLRAYQKVN